MIIIWGWRNINKKFGVKPQGQRCVICKGGDALYFRQATWFTLFFIPIFPYSVKYFKECTQCGESLQLKKEQFFSELAGPNVPLPPLPQLSEAELATLTMREITVIREKKFSSKGVRVNYFIDGRCVATAKNGETVSFSIDSRDHAFFAFTAVADYTVRSNVIFIEPSSQSKVYNLTTALGMKMKLSLTEKVD